MAGNGVRGSLPDREREVGIATVITGRLPSQRSGHKGVAFAPTEVLQCGKSGTTDAQNKGPAVMDNI